MASDSGTADQDDPDAWLRPAWAGTVDETDAELAQPKPLAARRGSGDPLAGTDPAVLLAALADAADALARLDARAAAADEVVRVGLLARLAYHEAAGWLAHAHAWVHPTDLALRDAGLTAPAALAAVGAPHRSLPQTVAGPAEPTAWTEAPFDTFAAGEAAITAALVLARVLPRLAGRQALTQATLAEALAALGPGEIDGPAFAAWWTRHAPPRLARRTPPGRGQGGAAPLPALLAGAEAARSWMEAGVTRAPIPAQALLLAAALLAHGGRLRTVFLPVWAAYPALGFGDRAALPTLRSDAAERLLGWGEVATWPAAFLHLVTESARMGLRELDRLERAAAQGREIARLLDRRSRLPDAMEALLCTPVLTSKAMAAQLGIAPQTGTALLRTLEAEGLVREVTGRGSFRAYAI